MQLLRSLALVLTLALARAAVPGAEDQVWAASAPEPQRSSYFRSLVKRVAKSVAPAARRLKSRWSADPMSEEVAKSVTVSTYKDLESSRAALTQVEAQVQDAVEQLRERDEKLFGLRQKLAEGQEDMGGMDNYMQDSTLKTRQRSSAVQKELDSLLEQESVLENQAQEMSRRVEAANSAVEESKFDLKRIQEHAARRGKSQVEVSEEELQRATEELEATSKDVQRKNFNFNKKMHNAETGSFLESMKKQDEEIRHVRKQLENMRKLKGKAKEAMERYDAAHPPKARAAMEDAQPREDATRSSADDTVNVAATEDVEVNEDAATSFADDAEEIDPSVVNPLDLLAPEERVPQP